MNLVVCMYVIPLWYIIRKNGHMVESLLQFSALQFSAFRCLIVSHFQTASIHHVSFGYAIYLGVIFDMCRAHVMNRSSSPMKALAGNRSCAENRSYGSTILPRFTEKPGGGAENLPVALRLVLRQIERNKDLPVRSYCEKEGSARTALARHFSQTTRPPQLQKVAAGRHLRSPRMLGCHGSGTPPYTAARCAPSGAASAPGKRAARLTIYKNDTIY